MEEYNKKRLNGLIAFTGSMSLSLASLIGLCILISTLQGSSISSVVLFIAGILATTISYLIAVLGGVPLPGPKKREFEKVVKFPDFTKDEMRKMQFRFAFFIIIMFGSQIGLFMLLRGLQGPGISSILYFVAGFVGSSISYFVTVSGGVLPPGPKGGVGLPDPKNG
jgi:hypothetical protein